MQSPVDQFRRQVLEEMRLPESVLFNPEGKLWTEVDPKFEPTNEVAQFLLHPHCGTYACHGASETPFDSPFCEGDVGRFVARESSVHVLQDEPMHRGWSEYLSGPFPSFAVAGPRRKLAIDVARKSPLRIGVLTAGGVAPGLNTVIHEIIRRHEFYAQRAGASNLVVLGFLGGYVALDSVDAKRYVHLMTDLDSDFASLYKPIPKGSRLLLTSPMKGVGGSLLGMGRGPTDEGTSRRAAKTIEEHDLDILYCVGGNGTIAGSYALSRSLKELKSKTKVVAIPKTIDNDVLWAYTTFGLLSAVEEAVKDIELMSVEARTSGRIAILELMGRHSGFIAANATLASGLVDLCLIPEVHPKLNMTLLMEFMTKRMDDRTPKSGLIVIAEGCADSEWIDLPEFLHPRALGAEAKAGKRGGEVSAAYAVRDYFNLRKRETGEGAGAVVHLPGYVVRSCPPNGSDRVLCRRMSAMAVDSVLAGYFDFVVTPLSQTYALVPLRVVAGKSADGIGGSKRLNPHGKFWAEVALQTGQRGFDEANGA